jgi:hypothetical protein
VNACGDLVLKVVSRIVNIMKWKGVVTCYNDSRNKRLGWSTLDGKQEVSYLGMIWSDIENDSINSFDQQYLVAYAKSCIMAILKSAVIPIMPLWSKWYKFHNGIFVGIKDINGNTRASIGNYQSSNRTIIDNTRNAAIGTVKDGKDRWKMPLNIYDINLNILQDEIEWKEYQPSDLIGKIGPYDNYR